MQAADALDLRHHDLVCFAVEPGELPATVAAHGARVPGRAGVLVCERARRRLRASPDAARTGGRRPVGHAARPPADRGLPRSSSPHLLGTAAADRVACAA